MSRRRHQNKSSTHSSQTTNSKVTEEKESTASNPGDSSGTAPNKATSNNDPEWYARDPYLLRDAASYAFAYAYGKNYVLGYKVLPNSSIGNWTQSPLVIPGVCALRMKPSLGFSDGPGSPLNTSARALYSYVRHINSGRKNYDPADIMLYLMAIANMYSFIIFCERAYACAMTYSEQNRYLPDALLRAMTLRPADIRENLADFRMWLNSFINRVSCFVVPANITYFNKVVFMYRDFFLENGEGNIKDQIYFYTPDGFYVFGLDKDNRGMLDYRMWHTVNGGLKTWTDIRSFGESMLANIAGDEDSSLISGDIFKVYGDNVIRIPSMDEFLQLPLVYDPMVLWQMKNSNICPCIRTALSQAGSNVASDPKNINGSKFKFNASDTTECYPGSVWQDNNGNLISVERHVNNGTTSYSISNNGLAVLVVDKILSSELAHPGPEVVMESSRNILVAHDLPDLADIAAITTDDKYLGWLTCGAFICQELIIVHSKNHTTEEWSSLQLMNVPTDATKAAKFRYLPWQYLITLTGNNVTDFKVFNDINNYVILNSNNLEKLHDVAMLSLLYVPGVAKIS